MTALYTPALDETEAWALKFLEGKKMRLAAQ